MKAVIGIGEFANGPALGEFVMRLGFPDLQLELVHVYSPFVMPTGEPSFDARLLEQLGKAEAAEKAEAKRKLESLADKIRTRGVETKTTLLSGAPGRELVDYANKSNADLIVIGGTERGAMSRTIFGSATQAALVGAKMSVLIVKSMFENKRGPLDAVFAVDHSEYCAHCVDRLAKLGPSGIANLTVLSVYPEGDLSRLRWALSEYVEAFVKFTEDRLKARTNAVAEELEWAAKNVDSRVVIGELTEEIHRTLDETQAELLIVGAQGHGLLERISLGSVSFHAAFAETRSILIVRV